MEEKGQRVKKLRVAVKTYIEERKNIAKWLAGQFESSLRTGVPVVFEFEGVSFPPVSLSAEIGEERRRRIKLARYEALENFKPFKGFAERRIVK